MAQLRSSSRESTGSTRSASATRLTGPCRPVGRWERHVPSGAPTCLRRGGVRRTVRHLRAGGLALPLRAALGRLAAPVTGQPVDAVGRALVRPAPADPHAVFVGRVHLHRRLGAPGRARGRLRRCAGSRPARRARRTSAPRWWYPSSRRPPRRCPRRKGPPRRRGRPHPHRTRSPRWPATPWGSC